MRQVILDTETTGLDVGQGHRVIEIGCVEVVNRRRTDKTWHNYINPERDIDAGAVEIHGISRSDLEDKPLFEDIAESFLNFVRDAELVIHNAEFDIGFLDNELRLAGREESLSVLCAVTDSLALARRRHPGQRNSLDALCRRYDVDNSSRELHGALLDAQILADVYLAMTGGQATLGLEERRQEKSGGAAPRSAAKLKSLNLVHLELTDEDLNRHESVLDLLDNSCPDGSVWRRQGH